MPIANHIVYLKFAKGVDLMLSVLTTKKIITIQQQRGWEETLEGDRCVYCLNVEDCIMGTHLCPNSELCTLNMYSSLHVNHTSIKGFIKKKKWRYLKYSEV